MFEALLAHPADFDGWRRTARIALAAGLEPDLVHWLSAEDAPLLFGDASLSEAATTLPVKAVSVAPAFLSLAEQVVKHSARERFTLLYRLLWRLAAGEKSLLEIQTDDDVAKAQDFTKAVQRDEHKMEAFVRFRRIEGSEPERFAAWFEPDHHIVEAVAPFFRRRFAGMRWTILTPRRSADWDGETLRFGVGAEAKSVPEDDAFDELWRTYYANIFNPARLKVSAMRAEMPKKYWKNLPEARLIPPLIAGARQRTTRMIDGGAAAPLPRSEKWRPAPMPGKPPTGPEALDSIRQALERCTLCPLHRSATQVVMGEGPLDAPIMIVGEQPGDQEDLAGRPFVGPAGQILDRALAAAGLSRPAIYFTNAVKHFKFEPRGKRRIHKKPGSTEINACNGWLRKELDAVAPRIVVALGATAARSLLGHAASRAELRGRTLSLGPARLIVSWHPAYLLRLEQGVQRDRAEAELIADLREAGHWLAEARAA